jgi:hypothetical protein
VRLHGGSVYAVNIYPATKKEAKTNACWLGSCALAAKEGGPRERANGGWRTA